MQSSNRLGLFLYLLGGLTFACVPNEKTAQPVPEPDSVVQALETTPAANLTQEKVSRRDEVEAMMLRGEYLHDGSSELMGVGDIDSVPALLVVLKEHPPSKDGTMVCTTAHALEALKELTGADPGITYEAWSDWWNEYKKSNRVSGRLEKTANAGH